MWIAKIKGFELLKKKKFYLGTTIRNVVPFPGSDCFTNSLPL